VIQQPRTLGAGGWRSPRHGVRQPVLAGRRALDLLPTHAPLQEIAATLFVSRNTVKSYTHSIYRKLDVRQLADAVGNTGFTRCGGCRRVGAPRAASVAAKISEALDVAIEVALDESA
jgi:hypothetical protein